MDTCPHCGAELPEGAKSCPECGSDEQTGWSEQATASGLDLPDQKFDYDDFVKREFGKPEVVPRGLSRFWWVIAIVVLAAFLLLFFH